MIPSSKIALRIGDVNITSHYTTYLRKAVTGLAMEKRYLKHYGWTLAQVAKIDWMAHHSALSKLHFAENLPIGKLFHKIDPSQSITCSSCKL